jgi:large subunit ribosomal protein L17
LLTKAKNDTTHSRRTVFAYLQDKESIKTLFGEVAGRIATRAGGYTRIIKLGDARLGDAADMCMMELVDFNDIYTKDGATKKAKTRRGRKSKKEEGVEDAKIVSETKEEKPKKTPKMTKNEE